MVTDSICRDGILDGLVYRGRYQHVRFLRLPGAWALTELPEPRLLRYCSGGWKFSRTIRRIPVWPFVYIVKAGQPPDPKTVL